MENNLILSARVLASILNKSNETKSDWASATISDKISYYLNEYRDNLATLKGYEVVRFTDTKKVAVTTETTNDNGERVTKVKTRAEYEEAIRKVAREIGVDNLAEVYANTYEHRVKYDDDAYYEFSFVRPLVWDSVKPRENGEIPNQKQLLAFLSGMFKEHPETISAPNGYGETMRALLVKFGVNVDEILKLAK